MGEVSGGVSGLAAGGLGVCWRGLETREVPLGESRETSLGVSLACLGISLGDSLEYSLASLELSLGDSASVSLARDSSPSVRRPSLASLRFCLLILRSSFLERSSASCCGEISGLLALCNACSSCSSRCWLICSIKYSRCRSACLNAALHPEEEVSNGSGESVTSAGISAWDSAPRELPVFLLVADFLLACRLPVSELFLLASVPAPASCSSWCRLALSARLSCLRTSLSLWRISLVFCRASLSI